MLYADRLEFRPNRVNSALHGIAPPLIILLADVVGVQEHQAIGANIIDVTHRAGTFSLRCFGAHEFAEAIRAAVTRAARR